MYWHTDTKTVHSPCVHIYTGTNTQQLIVVQSNVATTSEPVKINGKNLFDLNQTKQTKLEKQKRKKNKIDCVG